MLIELRMFLNCYYRFHLYLIDLGPDHIRILQKEGILPADLAEIKDKVKPRPALDLKKISE